MGISAPKDRRHANRQPLEGNLSDYMTYKGARIECLAQDVSTNGLRIQTSEEVQPPSYLVLRMRAYEVALVVAACVAVPGNPGRFTVELKTALPEYDLVELFTVNGWLEQDAAVQHAS